MIDPRRTLKLLRRTIRLLELREPILAEELEEHADELELELERPSQKTPHQGTLPGTEGRRG